jgi:hypothetical protein
MSEFKGTVDLSKPFLEQQVIAEFLKISPDASFPTAIMYRLLSIAENFIQSKLNESRAEIVSLRLNCEFLKKGTLTSDGTQKPESLGLYWVGGGTEASYKKILDQAAISSEKPPDFALAHKELDQLTSRICEVLAVKAPQDVKEKVEIVTFLNIKVIVNASKLAPTPLERATQFPSNFRDFRTEESSPSGSVQKQFYFLDENSCCTTDTGTDGFDFSPVQVAGNSPCDYSTRCP